MSQLLTKQSWVFGSMAASIDSVWSTYQPPSLYTVLCPRILYSNLYLPKLLSNVLSSIVWFNFIGCGRLHFPSHLHFWSKFAKQMNQTFDFIHGMHRANFIVTTFWRPYLASWSSWRRSLDIIPGIFITLILFFAVPAKMKTVLLLATSLAVSAASIDISNLSKSTKNIS